MARGQSVNLVIHDDVRQIKIAAHGVDEMIESDALPVAISACNHHIERVVGEFGAARHRHGAPMQAVNAISVEESRQVRRAPNARDEEHILGGKIQLLGRNLQGAKHTEVAAPRTPVGLNRTLISF